MIAAAGARARASRVRTRTAPLAALASLVAIVTVLPAGAQETVYAEIQAGVAVSVELGGVGGFMEAVAYSVYFLSDSSALSTDIVTSAERTTERSVFSVADGDMSKVATVEECQLVDAAPVCDPLDEPAEFEIADDGEGHGLFLEVIIPAQRIDWEGGFLRLYVEDGRYTLSVVTGDGSSQAERAAPAIARAALPTLSDLEQQYLEQRPFLNLEASPLVRGQKTEGRGFDDVGLSFSGGIFRVIGEGNTRFELTWDGAVATNDSAAFNHITLDAAVARNLWPGDWLPLTLSLQGQSDQAFDAFDVSANARIAFVLPFNLNLQSGAYRPALAPRLELLAGYGSAIDRVAAELEERFARVGYQVKWRVPIGEGNLVRLRHANVWNDPAGQAGSWHALWDVQIEVALRGMTYFVGYQKGEAAPLFRPIETTRIGFSFAVSDPSAAGSPGS